MQEIRYYKNDQDFLDTLEEQFACEVMEEVMYMKKKNPELKNVDLLIMIKDGHFVDFFLDFMDDEIDKNECTAEELKKKLLRRVNRDGGHPITKDYVLKLVDKYARYLE